MSTTTLLQQSGISGALLGEWTPLVFAWGDNEAVITAAISGTGTVQVWGRMATGAPEVLLATLTIADPLEIVPAMAQMQVRCSGATGLNVHVTVDALAPVNPEPIFDLETPPPVADVVADRLAFNGVPAAVTSGATLAAFTVRATNAVGTIDSDFTGTVTLTKESDVQGPQPSQRIVTLRAAASGLLPAISGPITVNG
jgi:hypothetical protein